MNIEQCINHTLTVQYIWPKIKYRNDRVKWNLHICFFCSLIESSATIDIANAALHLHGSCVYLLYSFGAFLFAHTGSVRNFINAWCETISGWFVCWSSPNVQQPCRELQLEKRSYKRKSEHFSESICSKTKLYRP